MCFLYRRGRERTAQRMEKELGAMGIDTSKALERARSQSRGRKRTRSLSTGDADMAEAEQPPAKRIHSSKSRSMSRGRSFSLASPKPGSGIKDAATQNKAFKMADKAQFKRNKFGKSGEADRVIPTKMPKHLFSGKMSGKQTRRSR